MSGLAGVPKETVLFFDPVSGEEVSMVRIAPIERKMVISLSNGTVNQPLTDPADDNVIANNFQGLNSPFSAKDRIEVKRIDLLVLRPTTCRESAALSIGEIAMEVGNTKFDRTSALDKLHTRTFAEVARGLGVGATVQTIQVFGNQAVGDMAGTVPFILAGSEEIIVSLLANQKTGFVAEEVDPLDPDGLRIGIPIMARFAGFKLGSPTSADANAGRSAAIPVQRAEAIPTAQLNRIRR